MFLFNSTQLLTTDELKRARQHIAWVKKYITSRDDQINKDEMSPKLKAKLAERKQSLKEIAETCLSRELGLKPYSVIRYIIWNKYSHAFVINEVELVDGYYGTLELRLSGNKLRQDGTIGYAKKSIDLDRGFIERRMLDGSWHSIIPADPIWIGEI